MKKGLTLRENDMIVYPEKYRTCHECGNTREVNGHEATVLREDEHIALINNPFVEARTLRDVEPVGVVQLMIRKRRYYENKENLWRAYQAACDINDQTDEESARYHFEKWFTREVKWEDVPADAVEPWTQELLKLRAWKAEAVAFLKADVNCDCETGYLCSRCALLVE